MRAPPIPTLLLAAALVTPALGRGQGARDTASEIAVEAQQAAQAGDLAAAIQLLEDARQRDAATTADLAFLGALYLRAQQPEQAFATLEPLAVEGAPAATLYNTALAAIGMERWAEAEPLLERAVATGETTRAIRTLGFIRFQQRKADEAYQLLTRWTEIEPGDVEVKITAVILALRLTKLDEATALLDGLPAGDPRAAFLRAQVQVRQNQPASAAAALASLAAAVLDGRTAERFPGQEGLAVDVLLLYGQALLADGKGREAVPALERATELRAADKAAWQLLGQALVAADRIEDAQAALQKAQALAEQEVTDHGTEE